MCSWCDFNLEPTWAEYEVNDEFFEIGLGYDCIVVSHYPEDRSEGADVVLEFPIKFCPMCGRPLVKEK